MTNKYKLLFDDAKLIRFLADVMEAIAETYNDTVLTVDTMAAVIEAEEPNRLRKNSQRRKKRKNSLLRKSELFWPQSQERVIRQK